MRTRDVVELVLDELKAGNAHVIEGLVISASSISPADGSNTKVLQRLDPLLKNRRFGDVLLQINAEDLAGAVVHVEVSGNLLLIGFEFKRPTRFAQPLRQFGLVRRGREWHKAEMLLHVSDRAKQALLFSGPQANANRTPWLYLKCVENAHHFHRDHSASSIVRRTGGGRP